MRKILLLIVLFNAQCIFSQNSESIDKIEFVYSAGGSSWGKNGIYSKSEIIELKKTEKGDFRISKQLKVNEKANGTIFSKDTIQINPSDYKTISKDEINNLLIALNTNTENYTEEFLKKNFDKPKKKEILKIAKYNDNQSYFKNDYDERDDTEKKYFEIQEFKYFDEYLKTNKPKINEFVITMDAWNSLGIMTFSKEETKSYHLNFFKYGGQPISVDYLEINEKEEKVSVIKNKSISIINLNVNLILLKILPDNLKLKSQLSLNKIRDKYIEWFLEHKTDEFKY